MNHHKDQTAANVNLSALIAQIMASENIHRDHSSATFQPPNIRNPNLEGANVGATMIFHRGSGFSSGVVNDSCGINIYVNNNIQGLNNSIMIGSRLYMGDPGVWLTLNDSKMERWFSKKNSCNAGCFSSGFYVLLILVIVLAFAVMFFM